MAVGRDLMGFGNYFQSEAIAGALPTNQNSPQSVPFDLYAEQINGSAFTCARTDNQSIWLYRTLPSVVQQPYQLYNEKPFFEPQEPCDPNQLRYDTLYKGKSNLSFIEGLTAVASNDCARIYTFELNDTSSNVFFTNLDGEMLIVPQQGELTMATELGLLIINPGEIGVLPRGIKCQFLGEHVYGYICESLNGRFKLPDLGPIGANGLASPHHFCHPHARFEHRQGDYQVISLFQNHLWQSHQHYHPLNVVAWKGNYLPYKYDLSLFNTINTVSFDHPDPSIFTVLTVPSLDSGTANIDFVIFPERWMVAEHTFRPPYFHKNIMSEFMGLIHGQYDAKQDGFNPGGFSIHNMMTAHGPDADTYQAAINQSLENSRYQDTLAFMFESRLPWQLNQSLVNAPQKQRDYQSCWQGLQSHFQ